MDRDIKDTLNSRNTNKSGIIHNNELDNENQATIGDIKKLRTFVGNDFEPKRDNHLVPKGFLDKKLNSLKENSDEVYFNSEDVGVPKTLPFNIFNYRFFVISVQYSNHRVETRAIPTIGQHLLYSVEKPFEHNFAEVDETDCTLKLRILDGTTVEISSWNDISDVIVFGYLK